LTQLPCVTGVSHGLFGEYDASIKAIAEAVNEAESMVHVEFFITAWDDTTDIFCTVLGGAAKNGRAKFVYNVLGIQEFATEASKPLPAGTHQVRMEFAYDAGGLAKAAMSRFITTAQRSVRAVSEQPSR
jgi:hypothetical protein